LLKLKRGITLVLSVGLLAGLVAGCQPQSFTDDAGRQVDIEKAPQRIIAFGPSITEILFELGLGDRIVGVSDFCDYPQEALAKPKVGNSFSPSIEKVVELDPDLVMTVEHEQFNSELEGLGITYVVLDPENVMSILDTIRIAGEVTGKAREGNSLVSDMEQVIVDITNRVKSVARPTVFFMVDGTDPNIPWTVGGGSFIHDVITIAGGENIASRVADDYTQLSIEEIVNADPDIIIIQTMMGGVPTVAAEVLEQHPIWQQLSAVREGSIYLINGDLVSRPGPRITQGLEEMAKILHPELFD
jgi:iron complex transport system substrate-binding protein